MTNWSKIKIAIVLSLSAVFLTILTGFMGAIPLLSLVYFLSTRAFWLAQVLVTGALLLAKAPAIAIIYLSFSIMVYAYKNIRRPSDLAKKGFLSALFGAIALFTSLWLWVRFFERTTMPLWLKDQTAKITQQNPHFFEKVNIDVLAILNQMPSILIIFMGVSLWLAISLGQRVAVGKKTPLEEGPISQFKTPESLIWIFILTLLLSFFKTPFPFLQEIAMNFLNITLFLYFLQGLSILSYFMRVYKFGTLPRLLVYLIFIAQVLLPICLGILDFWLNFRQKISKKHEKN